MAKTYREVRRALLDAGWQLVRQRGSHEFWAHSERPGRIRVVALGSSRSEVAGRLQAALAAYADDLQSWRRVGR